MNAFIVFVYKPGLIQVFEQERTSECAYVCGRHFSCDLFILHLFDDILVSLTLM